MKKVRILLLMCLMIFALTLTSCSKETQDNNETTETGTPSPEEDKEPSSTPEPATEAPVDTATPEPTLVPTEEPEVTEEPTLEPTEEPTAEPTEEPTPEITQEAKFADEDIAYDKPELLSMGVVTDSDIEWQDGGGKLYEVTVDYLFLDNEDREKYPTLSLSLDISNMDLNDSKEARVEVLKGYVEDGNTLPYSYYFTKSSTNIVRADSYVVSIIMDEASYEGGAHPDHGVFGWSMDAETGEWLFIRDVCNDCDSFGSMIAYKLEEKYGLWEDDSQMEELISYIEKKIEDNTLNFVIGNEGVTVIFVPYEIASYADGNLYVSFPLDETFVAETEDGPKLVGLFKKKYRTVADDYMTVLSLGEEFEILDLTEEAGNFETLTVCGVPSEDYEDEITAFYILINGEEVYRKENIYATDSIPYFVKKGNEKYIILRTIQASEDTTTYIFKIEEDGSITDCLNGDCTGLDIEGFRYKSVASEYGRTSKTVYDPSHILVSWRYDILGTNYVTAEINFTGIENGLFEFVSPYFDFLYKADLTLKKDFKAGMIEPELMFNGDDSVTGEMDMEVELNAGDIIHLEKCTADLQVFFSTENGEWGTFRMDPSSSDYFYVHTLRGEEITDIFDGILFAD